MSDKALGNMTPGRAGVSVPLEAFGQGMLNWSGKVRLDTVFLVVKTRMVTL